MATPSVSGMAALLFTKNPEASPEQVRGALRYDHPLEILTGEADFRSPEEYVKLDAQDIIKKAASSGTGVLEQLNLRYPVQDEMPMMFRGDADHDKYFQERLDDRAKRKEAIKALESEPGFSGPKTDWCPNWPTRPG